MQVTGIRPSVFVAASFPIALLMHSAAFFILPFLVPVATALIVGVIGLAVTVLALWYLAKRRTQRTVTVALIVFGTWLAWWLLPMQEVSIRAKFEFERRNYEVAVQQVQRGEVPTCLASGNCMSDGFTPTYLVFPFPGFLSGWVGIVYVPEENQAPLPSRLENFGSGVGCDSQAMAPHFYVCGFS